MSKTFKKNDKNAKSVKFVIRNDARKAKQARKNDALKSAYAF